MEEKDFQKRAEWRLAIICICAIKYKTQITFILKIAVALAQLKLIEIAPN